jgi:hypothetical protein
MWDILELDDELQQNRLEATNSGNEEENNNSRVRARTASRNRDIEALYRSGSSPCQISEILMINPDIVKARVARLEEDEAETREFLATGEMPSSGGYVAIFR